MPHVFRIMCISDAYGVFSWENVRNKLLDKLGINTVDDEAKKKIEEYLVEKLGIDKATATELSEHILNYDGHVCYDPGAENLLKTAEKLIEHLFYG